MIKCVTVSDDEVCLELYLHAPVCLNGKVLWYRDIFTVSFIGMQHSECDFVQFHSSVKVEVQL